MSTHNGKAFRILHDRTRLHRQDYSEWGPCCESMGERDEETGRYTGEYPREAFLNAIKDSDQMLGTGEIADIVGCAHDTAYKRLQYLENEGVLTSQKVGNTLLWLIDE